MLHIKSVFPETMPDGSVISTKVIIEGDNEHAGWHIPLSIPKEYLEKDYADIMVYCERSIFQALSPQRALNEQFDAIHKSMADLDKSKVELKTMFKDMKEDFDKAVMELTSMSLSKDDIDMSMLLPKESFLEEK